MIVLESLTDETEAASSPYSYESNHTIDPTMLQEYQSILTSFQYFIVYVTGETQLALRIITSQIIIK